VEPVVEPSAPEPVGLLRRVVGGLRRPQPPAAAAEPVRESVSARAPVRISRVVAQEPPPPPPASTKAERLARMLGTEVVTDSEGNATVEMPAQGPGPFVPFSTAPRTVSRAAAPEPLVAAPPAEAAVAGKPAAVNVDEIADTVIERLRRELIVDRERAGGPMDLF